MGTVGTESDEEEEQEKKVNFWDAIRAKKGLPPLKRK